MAYHEIKAYTISPKLRDKIFKVYESRITVVRSIESYILGYSDKNEMIFDGEKLILKELTLYAMANKSLAGLTTWKQCVVTCDEYQKESIKKDYTGRFAYHQMRNILLKYYSPEEYEQRLDLFAAEYDKKKAQFHYFGHPIEAKGIIIKHENCRKYDINGAHNYCLCMIFPKAAKKLTEMYEKRKIHPEYKKFANYYVGYLTNNAVGHRKTYNWIVQKTTEMLMAGIAEADGTLVSANTDGFIVEDAKKELDTSKELGAFKLEHCGPVWTYIDKNYSIYQYVDDEGLYETKGSAMSAVRDRIDLPNKKVVHYDRVFDGKSYYAENVVEEVKQ